MAAPSSSLGVRVFRVLCGAVVCVAVLVAVDAAVAAVRLSSTDPDAPEFGGADTGALQDRWYAAQGGTAAPAAPRVVLGA